MRPKRTSIRESSVEAYLVKRCKEIGALCDKFTSPMRKNVPDRIVTFWGVYFIEVKSPSKDASEAQARDHKRRRAVGADVRVINTHELVDAFIDELTAKEENVTNVKGPWTISREVFIALGSEQPPVHVERLDGH